MDHTTTRPLGHLTTSSLPDQAAFAQAIADESEHAFGGAVVDGLAHADGVLDVVDGT